MKHLLFSLMLLLLIATPLFPQNNFSGVFRENEKSMAYWNNASWESLINKHKQLREKGYTLIDIEGRHVGIGKSGRFWGIWTKTGVHSRLQSRAGWDNFMKLFHEMRKNGYYLSDIESMLNRKGNRIYIGVFAKGKRQTFVHKLTDKSKIFSLAKSYKGKQKCYITDMDPLKTKDGKYQFLAVYSGNGAKNTEVVSYDKVSKFNDDRQKKHKSGLVMWDYETYTDKGKTYHMAIYRRALKKGNKTPDESFWRNLNWVSLKARRDFLKQDRKLGLFDIEINDGTGKLVTPKYYTGKIKDTPDIYQHMKIIEKYNKDGFAAIKASQKKPKRKKSEHDHLVFKSNSFCGPTSVSNGIMYWLKNGYPKLNPMKSQVEMVKKLGSKDYMNAFGGGTNLYNLIEATNRYVSECGYSLDKVHLQHISEPSKSDKIKKLDYVSYKRNVESIDLKRVKNGLINPKSSMILLWGKYEKEKKILKRTGGHYITLVGYGIKDSGIPNPNTLISHNPSTSPEKPKQDYYTLQDLEGYDWIKKNTKLRNFDDDDKVKWESTAEGKKLIRIKNDNYYVLEGIIDFRIK